MGRRSRAERDPLPPLGIQYADYAAWQRQSVEGAVLQAQGEYWKRQLSGAPGLLELPTDYPRPNDLKYEGGGQGELDEKLTADLKKLSRRHGTTLFMTLLAGWGVVLSRMAGVEEVVVGTPTANGDTEESRG